MASDNLIRTASTRIRNARRSEELLPATANLDRAKLTTRSMLLHRSQIRQLSHCGFSVNQRGLWVRHHNIPGTVLFDGEQAQKGLALNRMCFSFNSADKP